MRLTKLTTAAALTFVALAGWAPTAFAATYALPIAIVGEVSGTILRVTVSKGSIRYVGAQDGVSYFEADMEGNACSRSVTVTFRESELSAYTVPYDVCSEEGFAVTISRVAY